MKRPSGLHGLASLLGLSAKLSLAAGPFAVAAGVVALVGVISAISTTNPQVEMVTFVTMTPPFILMVLVAQATSVDWEEGAAELVAATGCGRVRWIAPRLLIAVMVTAVLTAIGIAVMARILLPAASLSWWAGVGGAVRASWYLGALAGAVAALSRSSTWGIGAGTLYWLLELSSRGRLTASFHLFGTLNACCAPVDPVTNRWFLTLAGALLWGATMHLLRPARGGRGT